MIGLKRHHWNTFVYLSVSVLSKGLSVLLIPLYTTRLSPAEYGTYGFCQTFFWIAPPLISMALASALARFFFDDRDRHVRDRTVGVIAITMIALCLASGIVAETAIDLFPGLHLGTLSRTQLRIVVWICALTPITEIPMTYYRANESSVRFAAYSLSISIIAAGATLYFMLARNLGLNGLLGGLVVGQIAGSLFAVVFVMNTLSPAFDGKLIRQALSYSIPFIPHMVGNSLLVGVDRWALEHYKLQDGLGLYTLATQLTLPITLAASAWNEASSPRFLAAWRDGGDAAARSALRGVVIGFTITGFGTLALLCAGLPVIRFFVGARFQAAFPLVPWIGLTLVIGTYFSAFVNVLMLRKTTRLVPVLTFSAVAVNILLNIVLVSRFAVVGAIIATGVAYAVRSGILLIFALRALHRPPAANE